METLVLPAQDQLSQHQYWQKRSIMGIFSPHSTPPRSRKPDPVQTPPKSYMSSAPSSPMHRSVQRTSSDISSAHLAPSLSSDSPVPLSRPSSASGRISQNASPFPPKGRASPGKRNHENVPKGKGIKSICPGKPSNKAGGNKMPNGVHCPSTKVLENATSREMAKSKSKAAFVRKAPVERGLVDKSNYQKKEEVGSPPKVTILQRPQSKEAAMLDLAKITGLPLSEVYAKNGLSVPEQHFNVLQEEQPRGPRKKNVGKTMVPKEKKSVNSVAAEPESVKVQVEQLVEIEEKKSLTEIQVKDVVLVESDEKVKDGSVPIIHNLADVGPFTRNFGAAFFPPQFFYEKWAGPAFSNSPPPSSLPIPNFSHKKAEIVAAVAIGDGEVDTAAATKGGLWVVLVVLVYYIGGSYRSREQEVHTDSGGFLEDL